jgi:ribonuclease HI
MSDRPTMHIDGAARGNPGPAAYAVVIARPGQPPVEEADTIGTATNNVAEYTALVRGLEMAAELGLKRLAVFSDSELLVKQMNGEYRVKHPDLLPLYEEANHLRKQLEAVTITHVRRAQNARADALCNEALDGKRKASGPTAAPVAAAPGSPVPSTAGVSADTVRADAIECLTAAATAWATRGLSAVPVAAVWDQLWSILDDAGVLKKKKGK